MGLWCQLWFLEHPQKRSRRNQLIRRRLTKPKSIGSGQDPESQSGRQSDGYGRWCLELIVNRVDHCSSFYCGLPQVRLQPLDGILRAAAKMISSIPKFGHIGDFMQDTFLWLPVQQRILFILTLACSGRQSPRSASRGDFVVPHAHTAFKQHRAFSIVGPSAWNGLSSELCSLRWDLSSSFYNLLKVFIFARAWAGSASEELPWSGAI